MDGENTTISGIDGRERNTHQGGVEMHGENTIVSEMDGRGRNTHQEGGEKDGYPVARPQTAAAAELDARGGR